jgi:hypothetical protein
MKKRLLFFILVLSGFNFYAQDTKLAATSYSTAAYMREIPPLSSMDNIIAASGFEDVAPPKRMGQNTYIPGKGLPQNGDPLVQYQRTQGQNRQGRAPIASFDAHLGTVLNDPTGAIGPNHYVYAFNSGFGILDRNGNVLMAEASLSTLFPNETLGDPVVVYDRFADRFIVMEFSDSPNGFLIAICKGSDPVNDGWYTYRFNTGTFPDYEKLSIWSDGYYITANKDQGSNTTSEVVFAVERDKMLVGNTNAQMIGFPLPGISNSGFYSPGGFNATGTSLPPVGVGHPIVYMQDDGWSGVSQDHLKIWTTTVDWNTPANSSISLSQSLNTTPFDSVFNGGSFQNLDEPGSGPNIDALQSAMMFMTNYRRFPTHNSVVMNFVVDVSGNDTKAGIRWFELRQNGDNQPWSIYQEGTYTQPNGHSAFCGSINMDGQGNIGLGYTIVSSSVYTSLRYTGRLVSDPLGVMTVSEQVIANGDAKTNRTDGRYGDYAQLTVDPTDDLTFWHIGEYMKGNASTVRRSHVASFKISGSTGGGGGGGNCTAEVSTFPYSEGFENTIGQWTQATNDNLDWTVDANGTPSSNTGPASAAQGTYYIYVEASGNGTGYPNKQAILNSPCFDLSSATAANFDFKYHMYGATDMGSLTLEASTDNGVTWTTLWTKTGNQGNAWLTASINLSSYVGDLVKLRFNRITGGTWQADVAVDDVSLSTGGGSDTQAPTAPTNLTASSTTQTSTSLSWTASTDNVGVSGYDIFQDGSLIGSTTNTSYSVTGLTASTTYNFYVVAKDGAGNTSASSNTVSVTTTGNTTGCTNGINTFPYSEGFENALGAWTQATNDDINWTIDANGTPSSNTGPASAAQGTYYIYVEASGNGTGYPNKQAILNSPCFDLSSQTSATFNFKYHMYGAADMGSIAVEASSDNGNTWSSLWSQTGNQGNSWLTASIDLSAYLGSSVQLRFNRITGGTWQADIAIDDVSLTTAGGGGGSNNCAAANLTLSITFDNYPEETGWTLTNAAGTTVASNSYSTANPDGSTITETINGLASGDYTFTITDVYGDGICCAYGNGSYTLSSSVGTIVTGGSFAASESTSFCVDATKAAPIQTFTLDKDLSDIKLYPNPAKNVITIESIDANIESIKIFSMYGKLIMEQNNIEKRITLDLSQFASGPYFVRFTSNNEIKTIRFIKQ